MLSFDKLNSEQLKKLYNCYVYSYGWKYCKTSIGYSCVIGVEKYYELFGINDFILNEKNKRFTRI